MTCISGLSRILLALYRCIHHFYPSVNIYLSICLSVCPFLLSRPFLTFSFIKERFISKLPTYQSHSNPSRTSLLDYSLLINEKIPILDFESRQYLLPDLHYDLIAIELPVRRQSRLRISLAEDVGNVQRDDYVCSLLHKPDKREVDGSKGGR